MISDDERREVARRLRELETCLFDDGEYIDCGEVEEAVGLVNDDGAWYRADGVMRLADLIEPSPSCELWDAGEQECYSVRTVRPVDRDALLALADDMESFGGENDRTLRRMGVFVDSWASCARRTREALGVVHLGER